VSIGQQSNRGKRATDCLRSGIPHEYPRGCRVPPQEPESGPDHGARKNGEVAGAFDRVGGADIAGGAGGGGLALAVTYSPTAATATVALVGDADLDGEVGASDLAALQQGLASASPGRWSAGDFNQDGRCDAADYAALKRNFGASAPPAGGQNVPELTTLALLAIGWAAMPCRRRP